MKIKVSIHFFHDREIPSIWDEENSRRLFSVLDILSVLDDEEDDEKTREYWSDLKEKSREQANELDSIPMKLPKLDGKSRIIDMMTLEQLSALLSQIPSVKAKQLIQWLQTIEESIDWKSKKKAYAFWDSTLLREIEVGTVKSLQQIHSYLFDGLYDFAGQIRVYDIAKGGFQFALARYLESSLQHIEKMPDQSFDQIMDKYIEMNVAHPFMDGNGRAMRIWLDLLLKERLGLCVDWSSIDKHLYLDAMRLSVYDGSSIKSLLHSALSDRVDDEELYRKGIDYSYYYEEYSSHHKEETD